MTIEFININQSEPYKKFLQLYDEAFNAQQKHIEAISISSYDIYLKEVNSRFVNLKYVNDEDWIFFSNYNSSKSEDFKHHNQISALIFWDKLNVQIRMKARIEKTSDLFSDKHFRNRSKEKNASAISSHQSQKIDSYEAIIKKYEDVYKDNSINNKRPSYWGGYSFKPYSIEFWEGKDTRLNKRNYYVFKNNTWVNYILQP
jgi:pyridoxamine 5'-phosphate oxidase